MSAENSEPQPDKPEAGAERAWIAQAVAGDEAALGRLLLLHHARLVREVAGKIPPDVQGTISAEDIVQEAYVVAFQRIRTFELDEPEAGSPSPANPPRQTMYPWLAGIARNRLMDAVKAQRAAKRGGGRAAVQEPAGEEDQSQVIGLLEMLAAHSRTPSRSMAGHEAVAAVQETLAALPPEYREALRLRYVEALPVAEIAARMKRSEGAVQMLCHRALRALRDALGDPGQFFSRKE